jgi:Ca-activated chloride channel family protein
MGRLEEAREAYKSALRIDPRDRDAKFNIEVIDAVLRGSTQQRGPQQPGQSGAPQQQQQPGQGQQQPPSDSAERSSPSEADQAQPGTQGPQGSGPPTSDSDRSGPSLNDALREFRSTLTAEEALRLLDALMRDQRGVELLIEGPQQQPPGQQRTDPTY